MKILTNWLAEILDRALPPAEEIARLLTNQGLEVEQILPLAEVAGKFEVVPVTAVEPDEHGLWLTVDAAAGSCAVFCTDRTVAVGESILYAPPGTETAGGYVGERTFDDRMSVGMAASWFEAGLGGEAGGVARPDTDELHQRAADDTLLEIGLTPNRGDCLSHLGVARELAAALGVPLPRLGEDTLPVASPVSGGNFALKLDDNGCDRYALLSFSDIHPDRKKLSLIQRRIGICGQRALAPIVDLANYLLLEIGQPTHAFDADKIQTITVRRARGKEQANLLDGRSYELTPDDLVIDCDGTVGALAGVMGGEADSVGENTTRFALESARFDPVSVRRTRTRLGISTESSYRFERGVDPSIALEGARRFAWLAANWFAAHIDGLLLTGSKEWETKTISLSRTEMRQRLGRPINDDRVKVVLESYGFVVEERSEGWGILVPSWRPDVTIAADLIEEIARGIGYDELGEELPFLSDHLAEPVGDCCDPLTDLLVQAGFQETVNYDFYAPADDDWQEGLPAVPLANPLGRDLSLMRRSLLPGLLRAASYNLARQEPVGRLFEYGELYWQNEGTPKQETCAAALIAGRLDARYWYDPTSDHDAWVLLKQLAVEALESRWSNYHEKLANLSMARHETVALLWQCDGTTIARLLRLPPALAKRYQIGDPVWTLEIWPDRIPMSEAKTVTMQPVVELPAVERDLALLVPKSVSAGQVVAWLETLRPSLLESFWMFDHYAGKGVPEGMVSLGFRFLFRDPDRSLTAQEVDAGIRTLFVGLQSKAKIELREGSVL